MKGIPCSSGMALAKPHIIEALSFDISRRAVSNADEEARRFAEAAAKTSGRIEAELSTLNAERDKDTYTIRKAHLSMLDDPDLLDGVSELICGESVCAEYAVHTVISEMAEELESVEDELIRARAADLRDVESELLQTLTGLLAKNSQALTGDVVIVAHEITPAFFITAKKECIKGIICEEGSTTSHIAILCRANGIPAVFGIDNAVDLLADSDYVFLNGTSGEVEYSISPERKAKLEELISQANALKESLALFKDHPGKTKDGKPVMVAANIGGYKDACKANKTGAEGVGLYRTEFMYMECSDLPSEELQYENYVKVLDALDGKEVTIRTLDAGGDKAISGIQQEPEQNPFLGVRAIRLCLANEDLFLTQLRALLRAGAGHNLKIMIPMIGGVEELRKTKQLLQTAKKQLEERGAEYASNIRLGIMIEVPAAAICADMLAKEADFFSIGTNDLTQYIMAADRNNSGVANIYSEFNPAVLQMVAHVIQAAHANGIPVCVCGEFAGNPLAVPFLVGWGIDELSVSPSIILKLKKILSCITFPEAEAIAKKALQFDTAKETKEFLRSSLEELGLGSILLI
ncbi:MAG: phosphoenolpyruvate--protein phosphotransferase [Clostridia bacterium]|nr:phosphoenolpyruvate--protein phosphotransferase [Clostridia bacterium]MBR6860336.1 phosphoenolpyruvate--protein phosphotransferase [Acidaminococcaceae bacterium]